MCKFCEEQAGSEEEKLQIRWATNADRWLFWTFEEDCLKQINKDVQNLNSIYFELKSKYPNACSDSWLDALYIDPNNPMPKILEIQDKFMKLYDEDRSSFEIFELLRA